MKYCILKQQETRQPNRLTSKQKERTLIWHLEGTALSPPREKAIQENCKSKKDVISPFNDILAKES